MISQPKMSWTMLDDMTITNMPLEKSVSAAKKWV